MTISRLPPPPSRFPGAHPQTVAARIHVEHIAEGNSAAERAALETLYELKQGLRDYRSVTITQAQADTLPTARLFGWATPPSITRSESSV